jgi:hypothetical protein
MWRLEVGYRGSFLPSSGFDPFSTNSYFPEASLAASRTLFVDGSFSFAPGLAWDFAGTSATARGDATSLSVHRLTAPLEGRYHLGAWGYAYARVAPGVLFESARLEDGSAPAPMTKARAVFATDLSAGYAWLAIPWDRPHEMRARLWLQSEVGYGFAGAQRLALAPEGASGASIDLGTLSMSGAFFRVAAAVSF